MSTCPSGSGTQHPDESVCAVHESAVASSGAAVCALYAQADELLVLDAEGEACETLAPPERAERPTSNTACMLGAGRILLVDRGAASEFVYRKRGGHLRRAMLGSGPAVLASDRPTLAWFDPTRRRQSVDENVLCCRLVFLDKALPPPAPPRVDHDSLCVQEVIEPALQSRLAFEHWLALEVLRGNHENAFVHFLRQREAYQLISYLLDEHCDESRLSSLCVRYGLSYSQFRRLCHRALSGSSKRRLRLWRAARSVLDLIDTEQSVADVAAANGYTSGSHVANEIRKLFGLTPTEVRNAHCLLP